MIINNTAKILYVIPLFSTFIRKDLALLRKHFIVRVENYTGLKSLPKIFPKILRGVLWADLTISWFADNHAFYTILLSKIFGKKSIVIVGGYEVARIPEINYGLARSPIFPHTVSYVLDRANKVLAVSESLKNEAIKNTKANGGNILTVPNGYDYEKFKPKGEKENLVLTAFPCSDWQRMRLKGLDTFVKSASFLPEVKFLIIGIHGKVLEGLRDISPPNVSFINPLPQKELISYYQKAKVYCQLSMREGHSNALSEAMLCECIPVVTNAPGMKTVAGDIGFYVPYGDPEKTAEAIEKALKSNKGENARERIKSLFPLEGRENKLVEIINDLIKA
jgi:glycosyltransferase involved in cell wall biosynthesis